MADTPSNATLLTSYFPGGNAMKLTIAAPLLVISLLGAPAAVIATGVIANVLLAGH